MEKRQKDKHETQNANTKYRLQKKSEKSTILKKIEFSNFRDFQGKNDVSVERL